MYYHRPSWSRKDQKGIELYVRFHNSIRTVLRWYAIFTSDFTSVLSKHSTPRAELIVPTNLTPRPLDLSDYRGLLVVL